MRFIDRLAGRLLNLRICFSIITCVIVINLKAEAGENNVIRLGVPPFYEYTFMSSLTFDHNAYLSKHLQKDVELYTDMNFLSHIKSAIKGEYDLIITEPHIAEILVSDYGFQPIAQMGREFNIMFVSMDDSDIKTIADLNNKKLAITDPLSLLSMLAKNELNLNQLVVAKLIYTKLDMILVQLLKRQIDAGLTMEDDIHKLGSPWDKKLIPIYHKRLADVPNVVYLTAPEMPIENSNKIRDLLFEFTMTEKGKNFIERAGLYGIYPINIEMLSRMKPYSDHLRLALD